MFINKPHLSSGSSGQYRGWKAWQCVQGVALVVAALLFGLTPLAAHAATINVDGTICTLPEAIEAANTDTAFGGCTAGNADDTLLLGGLTHSLATGPFDHNGLTATPSITTTIVISGGIGSGAIVQRTGATNYRLFHVGDTGDLTVQNVTARYGRTDANNAGGAFFNANRLALVDSHVYSNTASGSGDGGGIENNIGATLTLLNSSIISNTAGEDGGGIKNDDDNTVIMTNTLIFANVAGEDGGAIENYNSVLSIIDSQIISNTSGDTGGGIDNYLDSRLTLINSLLISNTAVEGGGIFNYGNGTATIINSEMRANRSTLSGGGIHNTNTSTVTVASSLIISNSTVSDGGGIFNADNSRATITDSEIIANRADDDGGGVYMEITSTLIITASQIISNSAGDDGGGLVNHLDSTVRLTDSLVKANQAVGGGGAIHNHGGTLFLTTTQLISNSAGSLGGGIDSETGIITSTNSTLNDNHAAGTGGGISISKNSAVVINSTIISGNSAGIDGGGIYSVLTNTVTISDAQILANSAISRGGGIFNRSVITVTGSKLNGNRANISGGALYQSTGQTRINQSCIVNNSDTAVAHTGGNVIDATNNWWGSSDGPGFVGPGSGDSITANVTFSPFLTNSILDCSPRPADLAMSKHVSPSGNLGAGQPVTYTLNITNNGTLAVSKIYVNEALPAAINVNQVITAPGTSFNGSSYVIDTLAPSETVAIVLVGEVSSQLTQNLSVTNTATLTHAQSSDITKTTSSKIVLSELLWGDYFYVDSAENFGEGDTLVHIEVKMITPTIYATVTAQIVFTATNPPFANAAAIAEVAASAPVTFPPGSTSQEVVLTIPNTGGRPRAVELSLQEAINATVGPQGVLEILLTDKIYLPRLRR